MCIRDRTGRTEERRTKGRQRLKYPDSVCASWKDSASPTQLTRTSEDRMLWHRMENWPKIIFLSVNFRPKKPNLRWKLPFSGKFGCKIKIFSIHNLFCWKFAAVCRNFVRNLEFLGKLQLPASSTSLTHSAAGHQWCHGIITAITSIMHDAVWVLFVCVPYRYCRQWESPITPAASDACPVIAASTAYLSPSTLKTVSSVSLIITGYSV